MKRTTVLMTDRQVRQLEIESQASELKIAEIIRRAIDEYLERRKKERLEEITSARP